MALRFGLVRTRRLASVGVDDIGESVEVKLMKCVHFGRMIWLLFPVDQTFVPGYVLAWT